MAHTYSKQEDVSPPHFPHIYKSGNHVVFTLNATITCFIIFTIVNIYHQWWLEEEEEVAVVVVVVVVVVAVVVEHHLEMKAHLQL